MILSWVSSLPPYLPVALYRIHCHYDWRKEDEREHWPSRFREGFVEIVRRF